MKEEEEEDFYILIENRPYRHEEGDNDYHLEKIFTKEEILEIIEKESRGSNFPDYLLIITNDKKLLQKYILAINEDELKMLCDNPDYNKNNIRISEWYLNRYNRDVFLYFTKIKNNEIISATMDFRGYKVFPYDDPSIGVYQKDFKGWITNKEFSYFKTPYRYKKEDSTDQIFRIENIEEGNIELFKNIFDINILEIGNSPGLSWEVRNGWLRYFDKHTHKRIYITRELLSYLHTNNAAGLKIETKLDQNHYIEYYITGVKEEEEEESNELWNPDNDMTPRFERYNGKYGLDDNTIDSAFEGDPENYWNID